MAYIRIYPSRNNTIFKRITGGQSEVLGTVNTGKNPLTEITDGNTQSAFLMNFDITDILPLLNANPYTCNLKLWDAGVVFEPTITLKTIDLVYFEEEFIEGDGFTFLGTKALPQASNWLERVTGSSWTPAMPTYFDTKIVDTMQLNSANEDIFFEGVEASIAQAITNTVNPNFGIRISTNDISDQTFTKFLFTRHSRTVFKPFLEFFIDDAVIDERQNTVATVPANIYLLNETGLNFTGTLTNEILDADGTVLFTPTINNPSAGTYYVTVTPAITSANTTLFDVWYIDGVAITKNIIPVKSPNQVGNKTGTDNLFFYPTTSYLHQSIRKNDVVTFNVISEVRGKGSIILPGYEYRIVSTNNFEIQPWSPVSIYGNRLFFNVDTSYYYAPLEYEVFVRLKEGKSIKTSAMSYKFKLIADEATHMQSLAANPYSNRDAGFKPNNQR